MNTKDAQAATILGTPVERFTRAMFTRIIQKLSAFLAQGNFTISEVAALHIVGGSGGDDGGKGLSVQALGSQLNLSISATSRLVSGLVNKGLLLRRENLQDARAKVLTCSKKGARLLDQMSLERVAAVFEAAQSLPPLMAEQILAAVGQYKKVS